MRQHTIDALETIDAAVFTGDDFLDRAGLAVLRAYLGRWSRAHDDRAREDDDLRTLKKRLRLAMTYTPGWVIATHFSRVLKHDWHEVVHALNQMVADGEIRVSDDWPRRYRL